MSSLAEIYGQLGRQIIKALRGRRWTRALYRVEVDDDDAMHGRLLVEQDGSDEPRELPYRWKGVPPGHRMNAVREKMAEDGKPRWRSATFELRPDGSFKLHANFDDASDGDTFN